MQQIVRSTNGENAPIVENTVEAPVIENKTLEVSSDKEYAPDSKSLVELIVEAIKWLLKLFSK